MKDVKFFSSLGVYDDKYAPFYDNFIFFLKKLKLKKHHELLRLEGCPSGDYNSHNFNKICHLRTEVGRDYLKEGKIIFHSDLDIVFLRNPLPYLLRLLKDYDIIFQADGQRVCGGFYMARPSKSAIDFFDIRGVDYTQSHDQDVFSARRNDPRFANLKIKVLDKNLFPFGNYWYTHQPFLNEPYIVHYNWVSGINTKINKMKEYGHWKV
jgi:hypothetical protein